MSTTLTTPPVSTSPAGCHFSDNARCRARAYLAKTPPAIAGQGGHRATYAAACKLVEFGLGVTDAWQVLGEWNQTHCQPPWTEAELRHKLGDAFRHTGPITTFATRPQCDRSPRPLASALLPVQRPRLPRLRPGNADDCAALAELRGLSREGVALASAKGLLRFGEFHGRPAWFVLDRSRRVAQARRLDGQLWSAGGKALNLPGSQAAWPVGIGEASGFSAIALVEGGPDLLAACAFLLAEGREADCAPVAMLGGCARIHADALPRFAGKRVRLFPHADSTGADAADRWAEQLTAAGAVVEVFSLAGLRRVDDAPVKDLCDLAQIHADDFANNPCLQSLFP